MRISPRPTLRVGARWDQAGESPEQLQGRHGDVLTFLGRYVRDGEMMTLMEGLRRITLLAAQRLETVSTQAARKGRLQVGADADITVFDPARIIDTATFEDDHSYSEGVEFVLVNGESVVRDGTLVEGARPGRAVVGRGRGR